MMQFKAILIDAYRQLSAAKLFWVTIGLSVIVVILFGSIGFNEQGVSMFFGAWEIESDQLREGSPWARGLYIGIYSNFLVNIWLAWIATVLALISTCSIFPEFVHDEICSKSALRRSASCNFLCWYFSLRRTACWRVELDDFWRYSCCDNFLQLSVFSECSCRSHHPIGHHCSAPYWNFLDGALFYGGNRSCFESNCHPTTG